MLKQKLMGLALVALGILSAVITSDGTAAVMILPIGLGAIFTKEYILTDDTRK